MIKHLRILRCRPIVLGLILLSFSPRLTHSQATYFFYNDSKADALIRKGLQLSYNLEYAAANNCWDELIRMYPDHPAGYVYKATLTWWQAVEDHENRSLENQFDQQTQTAISKGMSWIQNHPRDKLGLAYLASAYGNVTRFDVTVTHSYLSALRNGKKAHKYILMAHQLDPNFYDAYIGLGSFNYFTGALPGVIKPFAWLLGARGDKNEGIKQIQLAVEKGEYARTEAKIVLLSVYFSEKRWEDYQMLLESLMKEYPLNHVFYFWGSNYYIMMKRWDAGITAFKALEKSIDSNHNGYGSNALAWLDFNLGRNYFAKQDWENALLALTQGEKRTTKNPVLLAQLFLMKGNTLDILGRRSEALSSYQKVLEYPSYEDSAEKAKRYIKSKYGQ